MVSIENWRAKLKAEKAKKEKDSGNRNIGLKQLGALFKRAAKGATAEKVACWRERAAGDKHSGEVVQLVIEAEDLQKDIRSLESRLAKQLIVTTDQQRTFSVRMLLGSCQRALVHLVSGFALYSRNYSWIVAA